MFRPTALIPIFDHGSTIASVVEPLRSLGLPCRIVDDGSAASTKEQLEALRRRFDDTQVWTLERNGGKGAALRVGFERVAEQGFTHAVVLDADGQHDVGDVPRFLRAAERHPTALILGSPVFGDDAPAARLYGRKISQVWVHIETLSRAIDDPLCGFRCYPVRETLHVFRTQGFGARMDFDPEIAVRLAWSGSQMLNVRTRVQYPRGGLSHFRMGRDNLAISWMHTKLVLEMLTRIPSLFARRRPLRLEEQA
ncbi:MAG: glycosyltransferase family 2 protein [Planctomycetes bacterium]|nr:glycosyltransferase family 2 protein [Planctomycetota bacterium]